MNFEPQKFFIGLMDFFSILLPGALLTYLLMDKVGPIALGEGSSELSGAKAWAVFLFASYLFGHLVFLLGSWLDEVYDLFRRNTLNKQITLMAHRGYLLLWPARVVVWLLFKRERNLAVDKATEIKQQALTLLNASSAINTFQWSKTVLASDHPELLAEVQRFEADSKFFRCLSVVLILLLLIWPWLERWTDEGRLVVLGLLLMALWRYMEQRLKATNRAYWAIITITAKKGNVEPVNSQSSSARPQTQVGGVVYRKRWGKVQYLLVEDKNYSAKWGLPKGDIEASEHIREAAVREVLEETSLWARIESELGDLSHSVDGKILTTKYYLMRVAGRGMQKDEDRKHKWCSLEESIKNLCELEIRELLQLAEHQLKRA